MGEARLPYASPLDWQPTNLPGGPAEKKYRDIISQLATQHGAQLAVAQPEQYVLDPVCYASLEEAKQGVQRRLASLKGCS